MYKILTIIGFFCAFENVFAQINTPTTATVPFGSNASYSYGIKPTNLPTGGTFAHSQDAANAYNTWVANYVENCGGTPTKYRVRFDNPSETVSEGIAYGMLLAAYAGDKNLFDGLWLYYKTFSNSNGLMNWKTSGCTSVSGSGSATDADLDAALALRVAIVQWPSTTSYATDLSAILTAIRTYDIQAATSTGAYQTNNGDNWGQGNGCRNPSYQSPAYYKVFKAYEPAQNTLWTNVENASYTLLNANVNATTGLASNWCDVNGVPNSCNGANEYGWDACRFPWRMATDAIWWNSPTALTRCASLANYIQTTGVPNLKGPVSQAGGTGSYHSPAFVSTWACSLMGASSSYQATLNAAYTETVNVQDALPYYFGNTLRVLALFQMTGNFWNPATINTNNPCTSSGLAINVGANASICTGASLSRTVTASGGASPYTFSWSNSLGTGASKTLNPTTTTTYSVTVTDANACTATNSFTVTVNSLPAVNAGTDVNICTSQSTTLSATGAATYLWNTGATTASISVNPTITTTYTVTGTSAQGCTASDAVVVNVGTMGTPTVPTNVDASDGLYSTGVVINWTQQPCYFYRVYRSTANNSATGTALTTTWLASNTFQDLTAVEGIIYYYWVKAAKTSTGTAATTFSTVNTGYRKLSAPTNVAASDGTSTANVKITWTGISGMYYKVYRNTSNSSATAIALTSTWATPSTYNDVTATAGVNYYYWVKASKYTTGTPSSDFSTSDAGFRAVIPSIPTSINATDGTYNNKVNITWTGSAGAYFQVYRNTINSSTGSTLLTSWINTATYDDNSVTPGTTYYYFVKAAANSAGLAVTAFSISNSGFANTSSVGTATTPNSASASDGAYNDRVRVTWGGNGTNFFMVYRSTTNNSATATALFSTWTSAMFYDDFTAVPDTNYYYWVKAATSTSGAGVSPFSNSDVGYARSTLLIGSFTTPMAKIKEVEAYDFQLFPNPIKEDFTIQWESKTAQIWTLHLYDATGKLCLTEVWEGLEGKNTQTLHSMGLPNGCYLLILSDDSKEQRLQKNVLIER